MSKGVKHIVSWLNRDISIAPLVTFRVLFGMIMVYGTLRFLINGWVERLYDQAFYFKFYGFEWVPALDLTGMYAVYILILAGALGILFGAFYRWSVAVFLIGFTYAELVDATNYLNHYYLVILLGALLLLLPAHRAFSVDCFRARCRPLARIPRWNITVLQLQLGLVYFFAGFAKLNSDWLLHGMPLATWLPDHSHWPLIGSLFTITYFPLLMSWAAAFYDLTIPFWLSCHKTRLPAYGAVVVFHTLTGLLFNIGMFPLIMTGCTLVFFSPGWHKRLWNSIFSFPENPVNSYDRASPIFSAVLSLFFLVQIMIPLRHYVLPGHVLWNQAGYRFSWRVMLVEKHGHARFTVHDSTSDRWAEVQNGKYLSEFQEKNMAIHPDFILQFAHFIEQKFSEEHGFTDPEVRAESFVSLNGRPARRFVRQGIDLTDLTTSQLNHSWINTFRDE